MQVIVIGGGVSGLACAFRLRELGVETMLLEASGRFGGVIDSVETDGFLFECGPQSFLATPPLLDLIRRLGLESQLLLSNPRAPRYVLLHGKLVSAPLSPPSLLTSPLLGTMTKLRLLIEPGWPSRPPENDESIAGFVRRKFGRELLDRLVAPFVAGVYAGDPEQLSLRSAFPAIHELERKYGSVIRGAIKMRPKTGEPRPGLASFRHGVATLARALGEALGALAMPGASVTALVRNQSNGKAGYAVEYSRAGKSEKLEAAAVVVASPTSAAAGLLGGISSPLAAGLQRISYAPVAVVALGYRREHIRQPIDGFGFLIPRSEGIRVLGTVWNSSLFSGRSPEGRVLLTSFVGGATDPGALQLSEDELFSTVERELAAILQIAGPPVARFLRGYERALPQYNLGHGEILAALRGELARHPGLFLAGNYFGGPSIGSCVEEASRVAEHVRQYCNSLDRSPAASVRAGG